MANSLSKRIRRLIAQEFSSFVASLEQSTPREAMEQALAEIDATIADVRTQLGQELALQHHAKARLETENLQHTALTAEIDRAVTDEATARAEAAIAKQLDIETQLPILKAHVQEGNERIRELEQYIRALQARKRELQEEGVVRQLADRETDVRLAELDEVVRSHTIAERLAAAKARIQKS